MLSSIYPLVVTPAAKSKRAERDVCAACKQSPTGPVTVLTVAGSDSGAGAGVQADLRTMAAHGVYGTSVLTAVTAQNTRGVQAVFEVPEAVLRAQLLSVFDDFNVDALKVGLLPGPEAVRVVAEVLCSSSLASLPVVVDPVLVSTSGHALARREAADALRAHLLPRATVLTPNLSEAAALLGWTSAEVGTSEASLRLAAAALADLGPAFVLLKGGHAGDGGYCTDVLACRDSGEAWALLGPRVSPALSLHGTGCTLAAAITCRLALGDAPIGACSAAKAFVARVIRGSAQLRLGAGPQHPMDTLLSWHCGHAPCAVTSLDLSVYCVTPDGAAAAWGEDGLIAAVAAAVAGGATAVQLREKRLAGGAYARLAARVLRVCRPAGGA